MALQGTLDTFELADVLRLLASTRKSGRLNLQSDRGSGDVWLADGRIVGVDTPVGPATLGDGLFDLLRAREGAFAFQPGESAEHAVEPAEVEPLLAETEAALADWREIEAVVPSLAAWVVLNPELAGPEVTVDAATWRLVATIGSGVCVAELGDFLGLGEVAVSRLVRDLVVLGLGAVVDAPELASPLAAPAGDAVADPEPFVGGPVFEPAYEPVAEPGPLFGDPAPAAYADVEPVAYADPAPEPEPTYEPAPTPADDADEVARQLAMLSPRAAQAIAAVASEDDGPAPVEPGDDGDEPINRGLLLKFLSSVKT